MTDNVTWVGNWKDRILESIESSGASSIEDFLAQFPCVPYHKVAHDHLRDSAAIQLVQLQFEFADQTNNLRAAAIDCLSRELADKLKRGWGHHVHRDFNRANTFSSWIVHIRNYAPKFEQSCRSVWEHLLRLNPPNDWIPKTTADQYLVAAFEAGWPCEAT
jgi:hypothetical protein